MTWTKEKPTEPGWYWTKRKGCCAGVTCFITSGEMTTNAYIPRIIGWNGAPIDPSEFEWFAGPIPEPEGGE